MNKSITGIKDQDREILLNIQDDKDLLKACTLNKYFFEKVCDDIFFRNRLARTYPDSLKYKSENENWKYYFLRVIYYIAKMKEDYEYRYQKGNPKVQYEVFKTSGNDKNNLLDEASRKGELTLVKEALKRGANISVENDYALIWASANGHLEVVKYLIEHGANISAQNDEALIWASEDGHLEVVKYLVEHGANISARNDLALRLATRGGHLEVVKYLVEHGANVSAQDDWALMSASYNGHLEIVKYLVEHGANILAQDDQALRWASENGHLQVVKYLESLQ